MVKKKKINASAQGQSLLMFYTSQLTFEQVFVEDKQKWKSSSDKQGRKSTTPEQQVSVRSEMLRSITLFLCFPSGAI